MKQNLTIIVVLAMAIGLVAFGINEDKKYKVEFTQNEWQARWNWIETAKDQLRRSDLPSKTVVFINDSLLGRFQQELAVQLQPQFAADTIKSKPKK
jgi:hypothetical protein